MSAGNRIKYIDHKFKPGHLISGKAFTSKITGAKYRIILRVENKDDLQFFIRNERTKEHVFKSDIYTNMNVLKRKARRVGTSLVITIPSSFAQCWDINDGDWMEIMPLGLGEFKIKRLKK